MAMGAGFPRKVSGLNGSIIAPFGHFRRALMSPRDRSRGGFYAAQPSDLPAMSGGLSRNGKRP